MQLTGQMQNSPDTHMLRSYVYPLEENNRQEFHYLQTLSPGEIKGEVCCRASNADERRDDAAAGLPVRMKLAGDMRGLGSVCWECQVCIGRCGAFTT